MANVLTGGAGRSAPSDPHGGTGGKFPSLCLARCSRVGLAGMPSFRAPRWADDHVRVDLAHPGVIPSEAVVTRRSEGSGVGWLRLDPREIPVRRTRSARLLRTGSPPRLPPSAKAEGLPENGGVRDDGFGVDRDIGSQLHDIPGSRNFGETRGTPHSGSNPQPPCDICPCAGHPISAIIRLRASADSGKHAGM